MRVLVFLPLALLYATIALCQPINDTCTMATNITPVQLTCDGTTLVNGTTIDATVDNIAGLTCIDPSDVGVWYSFVAQGPDLSITEQTGATDLEIALFTGADACSGPGTELYCGTLPFLTTDILDNQLVPGATYFIFVTFEGGGTGNFDLCIDNWPSLPNATDPCAGSAALITGGTVSGSTYGTNSGFDSNCSGLYENMQYFDYAVPMGIYKVEVRVTSPDLTDDLYLIVGQANAGCNAIIGDEFCDIDPSGAGFLSDPVCVPAGETIQIGLASRLDNNGEFMITVTDILPDNCSDNEVCEIAEVVNVTADCQPVIISDCNTGACPEDFLLGLCNLTTGPGVWYQFTADGNASSLDLILEGTPARMQLALFESCPVTSGICEPTVGGTAEILQYDLTPGTTYYVLVSDSDPDGGDFDLTFIVYPILAQDDPCGESIPFGSTTVGDNRCTTPEDPNLFGPVQTTCDPALLEATAWYEIYIPPGSDNVMIDVSSGGPSPLPGDAIVQIGLRNPGAPCRTNSYEILIEECTGTGGGVMWEDDCFDFTDSVIYYVMVGTQSDQTGTFNISVNTIPSTCPDRDLCTDAETLPALMPQTPQTGPPTPACLQACTNYTCPEEALQVGNCDFTMLRTTWHRIETDAEANTINIVFTPTQSDWEAQFALISSPCGDNPVSFIPLDATNGMDCIQSMGTTNISAVVVQPNSTYYLVVGTDPMAVPQDGQGGDFSLCVSTEIAQNACVNSQSITVVGRSSGLPLDDPFCPGETVTFEYDLDWRVDDFGAGNNCQWIQGLVPVFGDGWDLAVFDPGSANLGPEWDWYAEGETDYNDNNFRISTYVEDGTLKLAHYLELTQNYNVAAALTPGTLMPAGWFAVSQGGLPACVWPTNDPDLAYGAPASCGSSDTETFTFSAKVKDECMSTDNLDVAMFTFSDGAIGCWNVDRCGLDIPAIFEGEIVCNPISIRDSMYTVCSGDMTDIQFVTNVQGGRFVYTVISASNVSGAADGAGDRIAQVLVNDAECATQVVEYMVLAYPPGIEVCGPDTAIITVEVYDEILISDPADLEYCPDESIDIDMSPLICGGSGTYPSFSWSDSRGNTGTGSLIQQTYDQGPTTITVNVEDDFGCQGSHAFTILVRDSMSVSISGPLSICAEDAPALLEIDHTFTPSTGPNFVYLWTPPSGPTVESYPTLEAFESGRYSLTVSDDFGCEVSAEWDIELKPPPEFTRINDQFIQECPSDFPVEIGVFLTDPTVTISWSGPAGFTPPPTGTQFLEVSLQGTYFFDLVDDLGCANRDSFIVEELPTVIASSDTLISCDDGSGVSTWDLRSADADVLSGSSGASVDWFIDTTLTEEIPMPTTFLSGDSVVYAVIRAGGTDECDSRPVPVYLQFYEVLAANDVTQQRCLEPGGFGSFDLDVLVTDISQGIGTVTYYADQDLTIPITGSTSDFESGDTTLYAVIISDDGCPSNVASVVLTTEVSLTAEDAQLTSCLLLDGTATYDLTSADAQVTGGANLQVQWYSDTNYTTIPDPTNYSTTAPTTVYAEVTDGTCASNLSAIQLEASTTGPAGTGTLSTCDEGGSGTYDLISNGDAIVLNGATGTVYWYENSSATAPVATPNSYTTSNSEVYAIVEGPDGCISDIMTIELTRGPLVAITPDDLSTCGSGTAVFDLTIRDDQVSDGQSGRTVQWYTDAGATMPIANPMSHTSASGTVYAVVAQGPCVSAPVPLNLLVTIDLPANPARLETCIRADGLGLFNLNDANSQINSNSSFSFRFYTDTADLMDSITGVQAYQSPGDEVIFAIVFDGECRSFAYPVELSTSYTVQGVPNQTLTQCLEGNGQSTFDLNSFADQVSGGAGRTVTWYEDMATTILATPADVYQSGPTTLYAIITDAEGCVSEALAVDLDVDVVLTAEPADISTCDIGGGMGLYDLTSYDDEVTGGVTSRTVTWYTDTTSAPIPDPTAFMGAGGSIVYAVISDGRCISYARPYTLVIDNDLPANPAVISACDDGGTGVFNLENAIPTIIGTNPFTVEFYEDAAATVQITNNLTSYTSAPGVIYAVTLDGPCRSQPVEVTLSLIPEIVAQPASAERCDDGTGSVAIDLTTLEADIDNGQGFSVLWFTDQATTMPITDPSDYTTDGSSVWVILTNGNCNSSPVEIELSIITLVANPATALACDGGNGEGQFNLQNIEDDILTDPTLTVIWYADANATMTIDAPSAYQSSPGTVYAVVTDGTCTSPITAVTLELTESLPIAEVSIEGCDDGDGQLVFDLTAFEAEINVGGSGDVIWYTDMQGTSIITDEMGYTTGTGVLYAQVIDEPCRSVVQAMQVTVHPLPTVDAGEDRQLDCETTSLTLDGMAQPADLTALWTTTDGNITSNPSNFSITVDQSGVYLLTVTNQITGCVNEDDIVVTNSDDLPVADAGPDVILTCFEPEVVIGSSNTTTGEDIVITWRRGEEDLAGGEPTRTVIDTGTYTITVVNVDNSCESTDEVIVTSSIESLTDVGITPRNPTCNGANTGCITLDSVVGGQAPYSIAVDGGDFQQVAQICGLATGDYQLSIRDVNGCETTVAFTIAEPDVLTVMIEGERLIEYGDSTILDAVHTPTASVIESYLWSGDSMNIRATEFDDMVSATGLENFDVAVQIVDENGCTAEDVITIFVRKDFRVYVPNAFSPSRQDNANDYFYVYGDPTIVTNIDLFQVFDRWGELVYERTDVPVNEDREHGWNGSFRNERMLPGAFAYVVQVTFVDGSTEELTGSFLLID